MFAKSMLAQGGTVVTLPDRHFDVQSLLATIEREGVTAMAIVGDAFARPILEALDAAPEPMGPLVPAVCSCRPA